MAHTVGKDIYRELGKKIDNLTARVPYNGVLHDILTQLYSPEEADVIIRMPFVFSDLDRIVKVTKYEKPKLQKILENLIAKGLVMDFWISEKYYYAPSPMVVGIFELTMMRAQTDSDSKKWAKLFHEYLDDGAMFSANFENGNKISFIRTLPHEQTIDVPAFTEVLDYEKASALIDQFDKFSIGLCSCRHEKMHLGKKQCKAPVESCSSFGMVAQYLIRNDFAKEASKSQMLENIERSKEMGLVLTADNVQKNITFICHCCKCCCNALAGIRKHGYPNTIVTSSLIAKIDNDKCSGCGACTKVCAIDAIDKEPIENPKTKKKADFRLNESLCLGCGVCALKCKDEAIVLAKREKRVIHPETTFERVILQCLERGTLQNQLFDNPQSVTHDVIRGFLGGFLKLTPVKKALMSDMLRSTFLASIKIGSKIQGTTHLTKV